MNIYFIGINDNILQSQNNFCGSITVVRNFDTKNNICFKDLHTNEKINYNNLDDLKRIDKFFIEAVKIILEKDHDAYFMRYNEHNLKGYNLKKYHILSANDYSLYNYVNNKFKIREALKEHTNILKYEYIKGFKAKKYLTNRWKKENCDFVLQEKYGFAGANTYIFTKSNYKQQLKKLKCFITYCVSILQKNFLPVNIHLFIQNGHVEYFKPSQQIINTDNSQMNYNGALFNLSETLENQIKSEAKKIGGILLDIGCQGVLGIDFILTNNILYFMEINARFQGSTTKLNEILLKNRKRSLFDKQLKLLTKNLN